MSLTGKTLIQKKGEKIMKKLTAILLTFAIAVTTFVVPASAATKTKIWNGKADTSWYTGKKTSYDISTPEELAGLSKLVNSGKSMEGVIINLTADLVMNDTKGWDKWYENNTLPKNVFEPIGKSGNPVGGYYPFCGIFNGNGHTISGLCVNSGRTAGLFGYVYCGVVENLILEKGVIYGYDNKKGKGVYAGGIAGILEGGIICDCESRLQVYSNGFLDMANGDREAYAGGIVGSIHTENLTSVIAGITVEAILGAGGMVLNPLLISDGSSSIFKESGIYNCISTGYVQVHCGTKGYIGGIAGWGNNGLIKNCMAFNHWNAKTGNRNRGIIRVGRILGGTYSCRMENCHYDYVKNSNKGISENWSTAIKGIVKDNAVCNTDVEIISKDFAKSMGRSFVYVKNDRPYLACDVNKPTTVTETKSTKPTATVSKGKATIKWSAVDGAKSYIIYSKQANGKYKKLATTKKTQYIMKNVKSGTQYDLLIKAFYKDGTKKTIKNGKLSFKA